MTTLDIPEPANKEHIFDVQKSLMIIPEYYGHSSTQNQNKQEYLGIVKFYSLELSNPSQIIAIAEYFTTIYTISQTHKIDIESVMLKINIASIDTDEVSMISKKSKESFVTSVDTVLGFILHDYGIAFIESFH
ncbi:hypothetical protein Trydic_g12413 [Trypoxylus dichotomus]